VSSFLERILFGGQRASTGERIYDEKPLAPNPDIGMKTHWNPILMQPQVKIGVYQGMVSYEDQQPLIAPDGGIHMETSPGAWGNLYRAGRMYG